MSKLLVFSAPSGAGKTTIVKHLLTKDLNLVFSVSATSRTKREGERDGSDYYFISPDEFKEKIKKNDFVEWEEVYKNHFYGTLRSEVSRIWHEGKHLIFDIDVKGGIALKNVYGTQTCSIFIMPPNIQALKKRLISRNTDDANKIDMRVAKAKNEIELSHKFDHVVINDNLDETFDKVYKIVKNFLST